MLFKNNFKTSFSMPIYFIFRLIKEISLIYLNSLTVFSLYF